MRSQLNMNTLIELHIDCTVYECLSIEIVYLNGLIENLLLIMFNLNSYDSLFKVYEIIRFL